MKYTTTIIVIAAFLVGIFTANAYTGITNSLSNPVSTDGYELPTQLYSEITGKAISRSTPGDHISEEQIKVQKDRVIIEVKNAIWAKFTPTHSMDPVLSETANAIEIVPKSDEEVREGDIIAYHSEYAEGIIIHRVIKKGTDQLGTYYLVQGDNNLRADPGKVRFEQIKSVVVGIIY